jgi:cobalt-zinc-cadmium efflux system outer membrane protein
MYRILSAVVFLISLSVCAAEQPVCTEEAFLEGIRELHPEAELLEERSDLAEAGRVSASTYSNPRLGFNLEDPDGTAGVTEWRLGWTPPIDGRRGLRVDAADEEAVAAAADLASRQLGLRLVLREAYAGWFKAYARLELIGRQAKLLRELAVTAAARAAAGEISGIDSRRIALESMQADADWARSKAEFEKSRAVIRYWRPDLEPEARPVRPDLPLSEVSTGVQARQDLEAFRAEVRQAEFIERLSGRYIKSPELAVGWQRIDNGSAVFDGPLLSLDWVVPIFDRQQGARQAAAASLRAAEAALRAAERRAEAELGGAWAAYTELRLETGRASRAAAEGTGLVSATRAAYLAGEIGLTDLLDTIRAFKTSELAGLGLHLDALAAHRNLEAAAGRALTMGDVQ